MAALTVAPIHPAAPEVAREERRPRISAPPDFAPVPISRLEGLARRAAAKADVPAHIFLALVAEESAWDVGAVSPKGALGLAQLMPRTAVELGVDPMDPAQNLAGGARYLASAYRRFGTWALALAAYNAGPRRVADAGSESGGGFDGAVPDFPETRGYVARILTRAARIAADPRFSTASAKEH